MISTRHIINGFDQPMAIATVVVGSVIPRIAAISQPVGNHLAVFCQVTLPNLQSLNFGWDFNQSLEGTELSCHLESLIFGHDFQQTLDKVNLPSGLQVLSFEGNHPLQKLDLPNLQHLVCSGSFVSCAPW